MSKSKLTLIHDIEIYRNYLLIGFMDYHSGQVWSWELSKGSLSKEDVSEIKKLILHNMIVGFNSRSFDMLILFAALQGYSVEALKRLCDEIITSGKKSWDIERDWDLSIPRNLDHVDLIEVAPGKASLKIYNGRMHGPLMQDLPINPNATLTPSEMDEVYEYWKNDLQATKLLWENLSEQIALRTELSKEYGTDLRSKSDAQVAETVIKKQVAKITGIEPKKPDLKSIGKFKYKAPDYIRFKNEALNDILDTIEAWDFSLSFSGKVLMPEFLSDAEITFEALGDRLGDLDEVEDDNKEGSLQLGSSVYRMGIGGIHSSEKRKSHFADENHILRDVDAAAYYPNIIITLGLYPKLMGKVFLKVYRGIVERRLAAKAKQKELEKEISSLKAVMKNANDTSTLMREKLADLEARAHKEKVANEGGKIMINGSFGKLGSRWSALFSPDLLITVTLTGQLALLMLIERLEQLDGVSVVSGNTDGIVIKCHKSAISAMEETIKQWEKITSFETEATEYSAIYSRDVNNYIALKKGGGTKRKGAYGVSGLEEKKNPTMTICAEAVADFLDKGTPVSKTIKECKDITKFVTVRTVKGGAIWNVAEVEYERVSQKTGKRLKPGTKFDDSAAEYLGKAIRWYQSTCGKGAIHYKESLNRVPKSDGARPIMNLPNHFPDDIDFGWYTKEARRILEDINYFEDL